MQVKHNPTNSSDLQVFRKHDNSTRLVVNGSEIYQLWSQPQLGAMFDPLFTRGPMIVFGDPSVWSLNKGVSFRYQVLYGCVNHLSGYVSRLDVLP